MVYLLVSKAINRLLVQDDGTTLKRIDAINDGLDKHFSDQNVSDNIVGHCPRKATLIDFGGEPAWIKTFLGMTYLYVHNEPLSHPIDSVIVKVEVGPDGHHRFPAHNVMPSHII